MALFRQSNTNESRTNTFYDMPGMQLHGNMLIDKKTFKPITGYYMPTELPLNVVNNYYVNNNNCSTKRGTPTYISCALPNNFGLAPRGYMNSTFYPFQYIQEDNNEIPRTYIIDPDDPDIIYFIATTSEFLKSNVLVKYNYKEQKCIWSRSIECYMYAYNTMQYFSNMYNFLANKTKMLKIEGNNIYLIIEQLTTYYNGNSCNYSHLNKKLLVINKETAANVYNSLFPVNFNFAVKPIECTRFEDGIKYGYLSFGNGNDMVYLGEKNNDEWLFFSTYFDVKATSASTNVICNNYCVNSQDSTYSQTISKSEYAFKAAFIVYNKVMHTFTNDDDAAFCNYNVNLHKNNNLSVTSNSINFMIYPKASTVDKTIEDAYVIYMPWANIFHPQLFTDNAENYRQIYKFMYHKDSNEKSCAPITMLNKEGNPLTKADWNDLLYDTTTCNVYCKPYLIYIDNKKYLMLYDNYHYSLGNTPEDNKTNATDNYYAYRLFKFIDNDTLQLCDDIRIMTADLMWLRDDIFISCTANKITFVKIDGAEDKFKIINTKIPTITNNKFIYACIDDMSNFWYAELKNNTFDLNYVNAYTVSRIELLKEKVEYEYNNEPVESYIKVAAISDIDNFIARKIQITILGNAFFNDNNTKKIIIDTIDNDYVTIPFTINGTGEIVFNAVLTK